MAHLQSPPWRLLQPVGAWSSRIADILGAFDDKIESIPFWRPDSAMAEWMPSEILDEYGVRRFDFAGSPIYAILDIDGLLDGLRSVGATCALDDALVDAAFNGR